MQPSPEVFFKINLELGLQTMIPFLAFDQRSIRELLSQKNEHLFSIQFPLFYKNQKGISAVDVALKHNLINSANLMVDYIIRYQNNFVYSFLFKNNLVEMINKGVRMYGLLNSSIMNTNFTYDEWSPISTNY